MATATEMWGGNLSDERAERVWLVTGATDVADAKSEAKSQSGTTYEGLSIEDARAEEVPPDETTFKVTVKYGVVSYASIAQTSGDQVTKFSTTGEKTKVKSSIATSDSQAADGETAFDFGGAIGVQENGRIDGVDIVVPSLSMVLTRCMDDSDVTSTFIENLHSLTGVVNSAAVTIHGKSFSAGEVLFKGAEGSQRGNDDWEITFHFACSPNDATYNPGPNFTGTLDKKGWDYVWWYPGTREDTTNNKTVSIPVAAYAEQVYPTADLTALPCVS